MLNKNEFSKRLKKVLEYYQLSASSFAEQIDVQRSSISHLLSGRNKPSLDFVLKVLENFKEVELYWLLNGKGSFPKNEVPKEKIDFPSNLFSTVDKRTIEPKEIIPNTDTQLNEPTVPIPTTYNLEIDKIVIFYKNGTFKHYKQQQD